MALNRSSSILMRCFSLCGLLGALFLKPLWVLADDDLGLEPLCAEPLAIAQSKKDDIKALRRARAKAANYPALSIPIVEGASTWRETRDRYLQFRLRELDAYEKLTKDSPQAKIAGRKFIETYLRQMAGRVFKNPDYQELDSLGRAAVEAGSKDPLLVTYQRVIQWGLIHDHAEAEQAWLQTIQELPQTKYPRTIELNARFFLRDIDRARKGDPRHSKEPYPIPVATIVQWLEEEGTDSKWRECVCERLQDLGTNTSLPERMELLDAIKASKGIDEYFVHILAGELNFLFAWGFRGTGAANTVTADNWKRFGYYSTHAADHWEYAWFLYPELPLAPCRIGAIALSGRGTGEPHQFWFQRTIEANFDFYEAYTQMLMALQPRWGGSYRKMFEFASNCVQTERFDTVVPYIAVEMLKVLRDQEQIDLSDQPAAAQLLREFAAKREAYRKASPGAYLYEDNGSYHADIILLMEQCQLPDLAAAELQVVWPNVDWPRLRHNRRTGRYLGARLMATQGALGQRVLPFDEKLRQPWDADVDLDQLKWLTDEYQELKGLAPAGDPAETYLAHAAVILEQLRQFSSGDWAEMRIDQDLNGWEPYAEQLSVDNSAVDLIAWQGAASNQANLRPLANFRPPLEIEATFELRGPHPWVNNPGIGWSREGSIAELYPLQKKSLKFAIESSMVPLNGQIIRRDFVHNQGLPSSTDRYPLKSTGHHRLRLKLWDQSAEFSVDDTIWSTTQLSQPWDGEGFLCLGSNLDAPQTGTLRLSDIRIRKVGGPPPPAESESLEVRSKYWDQRQATGPADDPVTMAQICRIRFEQKRFEDVLSLAKQLLDQHPGMNDVSIWKARALLGHRHDEAGALLELQANRKYEDRDDVEVMSSISEIMSMAKDESLRDGKQALSLAQAAFEKSQSKHARSLAAQAAAEADLGDFKAATDSLTSALQLATKSEKQEWEPRLVAYKAGKPYRFPAVDAPSSESPKSN
jgi:hypothetical protein